MVAWVLAMALCPSVRLSVLCMSVCCVRASQVEVLSKRLNESELLSTYFTLCYKQIWVPTNIRACSSGTVPLTLD